MDVHDSMSRLVEFQIILGHGYSKHAKNGDILNMPVVEQYQVNVDSISLILVNFCQSMHANRKNYTCSFRYTVLEKFTLPKEPYRKFMPLREIKIP